MVEVLGQSHLNFGSIKFITSSVKLKNQLKIYFKQAFYLFLDLPQALTPNDSY